MSVNDGMMNVCLTVIENVQVLTNHIESLVTLRRTRNFLREMCRYRDDGVERKLFEVYRGKRLMEVCFCI
jgi:hypothetical protein